jgi:hypothetical protein
MEPEVYNGRRGWPDTQTITGADDPLVRPKTLPITWYGTGVDENEGAFCMIAAGSDFEYLVGEYVRVTYGTRTAKVYCIGGSSELGSDIALARRAYLALAPLWDDEIQAVVAKMVA